MVLAERLGLKSLRVNEQYCKKRYFGLFSPAQREFFNFFVVAKASVKASVRVKGLALTGLASR